MAIGFDGSMVACSGATAGQRADLELADELLDRGRVRWPPVRGHREVELDQQVEVDRADLPHPDDHDRAALRQAAGPRRSG